MLLQSCAHFGCELEHACNKNVKNVVTTSTDVDVTPELKNRMWVLAIDESPEQTRAIKKFKLEQARLPPSQRINRETQKKILRCAMKMLKEEAPNTGIIPYALELDKILGDQKIRMRRDVDKLLKAADIIARLNYKIRPTCEGCAVSTPEDFWYAMKFMNEAIQGTFSEETKRFWRVWSQIKRVLEAKKLVDVETIYFPFLACTMCTIVNINNSLRYFRRVFREDGAQ